MKRKEQQGQGIKDQDDEKLNEKLTSRLEDFEIKQTKKN